jgi:zinc/manganese transport system substrate-binding protein
MKFASLIAVFILGVIGVHDPVKSHAKTLKVVVSFTILADVVQNVGGDQLEVRSLVPPNGDPHQFEPSPNDARALRDADIVFISGEGFERWFDRLAGASGYRGSVVVASEGVRLREQQRGGQLSIDPHVWNSPGNVLIWLENIEKALISVDPDNATAYHANADHYGREIESLDRYAHARIDPVPRAARKLLTSHQAFGYLGRDYDITILAPAGLSTESEASASQVAALIDQIKKEDIRIYFIQNSNDPRLVRQIASATDAQPGGKLYAEALSTADGPASTYVKMFRYNLDEIVASFQLH